MPLLATAGGASIRGFRPYSTLVTAGFISATGGTITTSGNYKYHTFTSSGTFSVSVAPTGKFIDFIVVAGGGGSDPLGAGGGAGGVVEKLAQSLSTGSFAVTVGTGGAFNTSGGNSTFKGETAIGGGAGNASGVGLGGGSGGGGTSGGAALQPTSASGGYGYAGSNFAGGGAGGPATGNDSGTFYVSSTFSDDFAEGGPLDSIHVGPGYIGSGGGINVSTSTAYAGSNGVVIIRYLYQ